MPKNQKLLTISILIAAILIAGSIFYYTTLKNTKTSNTPTQNAQVYSEQNKQYIEDVTRYNTTPQISTDDIFLGNKNAPVTIIEYSSYFCGHCTSFYKEKLPQLKKDYIDTGKVKFFSRTFPAELAQATLCAIDQNKYQEFSDYLFDNTEELIQKVKTVEDIKNYVQSVAKNIGMDEKIFIGCFDSGKYKSKTDEWEIEAQAAGVEGTPTFFIMSTKLNISGTLPAINGEKLVGNQPYETFKATIEKALEK